MVPAITTAVAGRKAALDLEDLATKTMQWVDVLATQTAPAVARPHRMTVDRVWQRIRLHLLSKPDKELRDLLTWHDSQRLPLAELVALDPHEPGGRRRAYIRSGAAMPSRLSPCRSVRAARWHRARRLARAGASADSTGQAS